MGHTDSDGDTEVRLRLGDDEETPLEQVVVGLVVALIFVVGFGLLAMGWPWFWVAFPIGFAGLLPAAIGAVRWYEQGRGERRSEANDDTSPAETDERDTALATLRERFARGDIDEEVFERQVAALLETGTLDDATAYVDRERERSLD